MRLLIVKSDDLDLTINHINAYYITSLRLIAVGIPFPSPLTHWIVIVLNRVDHQKDFILIKNIYIGRTMLKIR